MRCDMVVAVGQATADGRTLFGHNCTLPASANLVLCRTRGRDYSPGETVRVRCLELPQARRTYCVVGAQPDHHWGYIQGVNSAGLAVGCGALSPQFAAAGRGLLGTDLVRLTLERCRTARQGADYLTDLLAQYGRAENADYDPTFLLADGGEAFVIETAGAYWAEQEVREARAVSEVRMIRQDWDRIARGFAECVIGRGSWPADGSKLDFAGALGESRPQPAAVWRRWGRATLLLEQHNGRIDGAYLRQLLGDHAEAPEAGPSAGVKPAALCYHPAANDRATNVFSLIASLPSGDKLPVAWWAFGPPCQSIYLPVLPDGPLPEGLTGPEPESVTSRLRRLHERLRACPEEQPAAAEELARLQARFDQEAEEFAAEGAVLKARGEQADLERLAAAFMQHTVERFEAATADLLQELQPQMVGGW